MIGAIASAAGGLFNGIYGAITAGQQRKRARALQQQADAYYGQAEGRANTMLGAAENNYNARMAGAAQAQNNIYQNQANTTAGLQRNATDASRLLALGGAVQGQTNQALGNLGQMEAQDKASRFNDVQAAQMNLQNLNQSRASELGQAASQMGQASQINGANAVNSLANAGVYAGFAYDQWRQGQNQSANDQFSQFPITQQSGTLSPYISQPRFTLPTPSIPNYRK